MLVCCSCDSTARVVVESKTVSHITKIAMHEAQLPESEEEISEEGERAM